MADGHELSRATVAVAVGFPIVMAMSGVNYYLCAQASIGALLGLVLSPDLDVDGGFIGFYIIRWLFGHPVGMLWEAYWKPYSKLVPHRSWVSHAPVISTIIRILYMMPLIVLIYWSLGLTILPVEDYAFLIVGLMVSDSVHRFMDSEYYRMLFRRSNAKKF